MGRGLRGGGALGSRDSGCGCMRGVCMGGGKAAGCGGWSMRDAGWLDD